MPPAPRRFGSIHGVDFSGATQAGRKIWIASGVIRRQTLQIEGCCRGETLPGSGPERDRCLAALRDVIRSEPSGVFGLDFPFGLPQALVQATDWTSFLAAFPERYPSPLKFRLAWLAAGGSGEMKRLTDRESRTPFSPGNLRLYRQTYFGLRDLLGPLVREQAACVLPMQPVRADRAWLMEICPASTLKRARLYRPYKGGHTPSERAQRAVARARILDELEASGPLSVPEKVRAAALADPDGDALDSILAALATFQALMRPAGLGAESCRAYALEGYVYI
jgi:hypothetical protein